MPKISYWKLTNIATGMQTEVRSFKQACELAGINYNYAKQTKGKGVNTYTSKGFELTKKQM